MHYHDAGPDKSDKNTGKPDTGAKKPSTPKDQDDKFTWHKDDVEFEHSPGWKPKPGK